VKPSPPKAKTRTKTPKAKTTAAKKPAAARAKKMVRAAKAVAVAAAGAGTSRRVIFIDVENTSSEASLLRVLEHLQVDRKVQPTEVIAIGNWKSVGTKVARTLASLGAQLVHSAPAPGVRDWSDLWIAVNAGRWLAHASPGDQLDMVSDDRAFDAVHDAAASCGVICQRISYRHLPGAIPAAPAPTPSATERPHRPRRRGGRGRGRGPASTHHAAAVHVPAPETPATETPAATQPDEAHAASQEQIRAILARLTHSDSARWINLDLLANALKAQGFSRPPGSPRLITRVRSIKGVELNPNGMVRLVGDDSGGPSTPTETTEDAAAESIESSAAPTRRPRRRGGRRHRRRPAGETAGAAPASSEGTPSEDEDEIPF